MPGLHELLGILIVVLVLWFALKLARVAIRLILFIIGLVVVIGFLYVFFMR